MFETSQPNSENEEFNANTPLNRGKHGADRSRSKPAKDDLAIKSLGDLSAWIDIQLAELEDKYRAFETAESNRDYYQR